MTTIPITDYSTWAAAWAPAEKQFRGADVWWRGHSDAAWDLQPHIHRLGKPKLEKDYAGKFQDHARAIDPDNSPTTLDIRDWLFLMQHHGLPTRLLDWSRSFLIASYFAVMRDPKKKNAALWALAPGKLNKDQWNDGSLFYPHASAAEPLFREVVQPPSRTNKVMALLYPKTHPRMLVQQAAATIHSSPTAINQLPAADQFLMKFEISKDLRPQIAHALEAFGITKSYLFPDLDHLAEYIKDPPHAQQFAGPNP